MAVVGTARPIGDGRGGSHLEDGLIEFTRTYIVETDDAFDGPNVVLQATGLPQMYDTYTGHESAIVIARYPHPLPGTRTAWHVEVVWSTHSVDRDENPLNTRPEIEWGFEPIDQVLGGITMPDRDPMQGDDSQGYTAGGAPGTSVTGQLFGQGIVNSALDPYDPPPAIPDYLPVVRYTRNQPGFVPLDAIRFGNTVNRSSWSGMLPRQVWLKPIEANNQVQHAAGIDQPDIYYWRVRFTFVLRYDNWDLKLLNMGPNYLTHANNNPQAVKRKFTADGLPQFGLLKKDGTRYANGEPQFATYSHFRVKREVEFSLLGINLNLNLNQIRKPRRGETLTR